MTETATPKPQPELDDSTVSVGWELTAEELGALTTYSIASLGGVILLAESGVLSVKRTIVMVVVSFFS